MMTKKNEPHNRKAQLTPAREALLRQRLSLAQGPSIARRPHLGQLSLSFAQERLWFLDQLHPGGTAYNMASAFHLSGPLDAGALQQSLNEVVRRHESLRTTFAERSGQPIQMIAPQLNVPLPLTDLSAQPEPARAEQAQALVAQEAVRAFDLSRGPLFRAHLFRLGSADHILLLSIHHIVSDGWSMTMLRRELSALYEAFADGRPSPLAKLPIQYADFALWQRESLQGDALEREMAYWREELAGAPVVLDLPADRPRPPVQTFRGASLGLPLTSAESQALLALGRQEKATLFMTLLAALQTLLHRYTGQEVLLIGAPIANRTRLELEDLIGFFANTLVLRADLRGEPTFRQLLARTREACLTAYEHQDLPFERLVQDLQLERDLSRNPLVQVLLATQNAPATPLRLSGLTVEELDVPVTGVRFDLECHVRMEGERLDIVFKYNTDLFDAATIVRLAGHYRTLLAGILANREGRIGTLPLLSAAERQQLLCEWNNAPGPVALAAQVAAQFPQARSDRATRESDGSGHRTVPDLFAAQVQRSPDATALVFGRERLTYRELDARANQLAHYLLARGVGPGSLVGICTERSIDMMLAVLATMKAGAAYVPFDPLLPPGRRDWMFAETQVPVFLTQERWVNLLPSAHPQVICLDAHWPLIAQESPQPTALHASLDDLAYVLYTSGSTGRPKGIAMGHRPLANLVSWQLQQPTVGAPARTAQFASLSFDVSFQETFTTWCAGGTLFLLSEELRHDPVRLLRYLEDERVERLYLPFSVLQQLAETAARIGLLPRHLRQVITAGEQLQITAELVRWFTHLPHCTLHNHYGPTESHVVTAFDLSGPPDQWAHLPPIGRPIANTQIYILDRYLQPVPIRVPGQLYIGGASLARGYLGRPELTAERFLPDPFSTQGGARMYRSGDLACYHPDGNIQFLGRSDYQVKIRGFRVELDEIEATLRRHPHVGGAAAVVHGDEPGSQQLVAYVVLQPGSSTTDADLKRYLRRELPAYMVPAIVVMLEALPLTSSGKVDRRSLPPPPRSRPASSQEYVAPRTPVEQAVATIWEQVLKLDSVGLYDNFFEIGGHSLLATQVVARLRRTLGVELPLRILFERPTVAELAQAVQDGQRAAESRQEPPWRDSQARLVP